MMIREKKRTNQDTQTDGSPSLKDSIKQSQQGRGNYDANNIRQLTSVRLEGRLYQRNVRREIRKAQLHFFPSASVRGREGTTRFIYSKFVFLTIHLPPPPINNGMQLILSSQASSWFSLREAKTLSWVVPEWERSAVTYNTLHETLTEKNINRGRKSKNTKRSTLPPNVCTCSRCVCVCVCGYKHFIFMCV